MTQVARHNHTLELTSSRADARVSLAQLSRSAMNRRYTREALAIVAIGLLSAAGCKERPLSSCDKELALIGTLGPEFRSVYYTGTVAEARQILLKEEALVKRFDCAQLRTDALRVTYLRLHTLEFRAGNRDAAESYLRKVREVLFTMGQVTNNVTSDTCVQYVINWDKNTFSGIEPRYVSFTRNLDARRGFSAEQGGGPNSRPAGARGSP